MLKQRLLTVAVILPPFLLALFSAPPWLWALLIGAVALQAAYEWSRLTQMNHVASALFMATLLALIGWIFTVDKAAPGSFMASEQGNILYGAAALFWVVCVPMWLWRGWRLRSPWLAGLSGVLLLVPLWHALFVLQPTPWKLIGLMSIVWMADTAAYTFGRLFGRRKLAPTISPAKTWEGATGAALMVLLYVYGLTTVFPGAFAALVPMLGISAMMLLLSIEGDLLESWVKRVAGVKDSGTLLPGHGGILDRIDALTGALPLGLFALVWTLGHARG